jgi:hypothetical protein
MSPTKSITYAGFGECVDQVPQRLLRRRGRTRPAIPLATPFLSAKLFGVSNLLSS